MNGMTRRSQAGFTLIELLAVIVVVFILMGLALGTSRYVQRKGDAAQIKTQIAALETALEAYRLDTGRYPTSSVIRTKSTVTNDAAVLLTNSVVNSYLLYQQLTNGPKQHIQFKARDLGTTSGLTHLIDVYGNPYGYYCVAAPANTDQVNKVTFDLWSFGPDGWSGTADDITNWK